MKPPQFPGSITTPKMAPPFFNCSNCRKAVKLPQAFVDSYFEDRPITVALKTVKEDFRFSVFCPLGAQTAVFRTKLFLNTETRFDVFAEGLPRNALILDITYTPMGMFCMELAGNNRRHRPKGGRLQLFGFQTYTLKDEDSVDHIQSLKLRWLSATFCLLKPSLREKPSRNNERDHQFEKQGGHRHWRRTRHRQGHHAPVCRSGSERCHRQPLTGNS